MSDSDDTCAAIVIACLSEKKKVKPKRKQRVWMKEWLKKRDQFSHDRLVAELKISSVVDYRNYLRMDADTFSELLEKIRPFIEKQYTSMREPITAEQRLLSTLRYLISGDSFEELKFQTAIAAQTLGKIIVETCEALIYVLNGCIKVSVIGYILFFTVIKLSHI